MSDVLWLVCSITIIGVCEVGAWCIACEMYRRYLRSRGIGR